MDGHLYGLTGNMFIKGGNATAHLRILEFCNVAGTYSDIYHVGSTGLRIQPWNNQAGIGADPVTGICLRAGGKLQIDTIDADLNPATIFLTAVSGVVQSRTPAQARSDIGAAAGSISGTLNYISKFTAANDVGDSQIQDDGTAIGIGTAPVGPTRYIHAMKNQNGSSEMVFANYNDHASARSGIAANAGSGVLMVGMYQYCTLMPMNYGGLTLTGMSLLHFKNDNGLLINNYSNTTMSFATNNTVKAVILAAGNLGVGVTPTTVYWIHGKKDRNSGTVLRIENATSGTGAFAGMEVIADSTNVCFIYQNSSTTTGTTCGISNNGLTYIHSVNVSGVLIQNASHSNMYFAMYGGIKMTLTEAGCLGVGCTPTYMFEVESATLTNIRFRNTGNATIAIRCDANLTAAGNTICEYRGLWNGSNAAQMSIITGPDTLNKRGGFIVFKTGDALGAYDQRFRICSEIPMCIVGDPASGPEDDKTVWADTQTVLRVGSSLAFVHFESSGNQYPEALFNTRCSNPGVTYDYRTDGAAYRIRGDCRGIGGLSIEGAAAGLTGGAVTWQQMLVFARNSYTKFMQVAFMDDNMAFLWGNNTTTPDGKIYSDGANLVVLGAAAARLRVQEFCNVGGTYSDLYHVGSTGLRIEPWYNQLGIGADPVAGVCLRVGGVLRLDQTPAVGTITPDKLVTVDFNGTVYDIPVKQH
jgi:hypothetical protein